MKKTLVAIIAFLSLSFNAFAAVNINTATQAELETLDGIGPVKAKAIVDYRKKNGEFKSIDELEKVDGVGAVTLANVRKDVTMSGKTTVTEKAPSAATIANKNTSKPSTDKAVKEKATKEDKVKTEKETKTVGTKKAAESGKTAVVKEVKETKAKKEAATKSKADEKSESGKEKSKKESKSKTEKAADKK